MAFDFILVSTFSTKMALNTCGWIYSLRANPNSCTLSIRYFENTSSWYGSSFIAQYNILIRLTTTLSFLADDNLSFCVAFHDFRIAVVGRPHSQLPPELRGSLLWGDCVYDFPPGLRGSLLWGSCISVLALPSLFLCVWNLNAALPYVPRRHQGTGQTDVFSMANVLKFHAVCFSGHYRFVWIWGVPVPGFRSSHP